MKKLGILALALFMQTAFAQTNRFVYQVTMKPDASNKTDTKTENAYLDISRKNLFFIPKTELKEILSFRQPCKVEEQEVSGIRWKLYDPTSIILLKKIKKARK
jgi:GLPGLI family protein